MPSHSSVSALPHRYKLVRILGFSPPDLTQAGLHLSVRFSVPIPAPSPDAEYQNQDGVWKGSRTERSAALCYINYVGFFYLFYCKQRSAKPFLGFSYLNHQNSGMFLKSSDPRE